MENKTISRIASIILGVIIAVFLLIFGFKILTGVFTRASDTEPRDVVVSEIAQNTAKISWSTGVDTQGVIEYGTSPTALNFFAPEAQRTKTHLVELTLLSPTTTYYFQIRIGDKKFDNGGVPWTFTSKGTETTPVKPTLPAAIPTSLPPTATPTPAETCPVTNDCQKIKDKLGKGCSTQDYFRCIRKLTPTP